MCSISSQAREGVNVTVLLNYVLRRNVNYETALCIYSDTLNMHSRIYINPNIPQFSFPYNLFILDSELRCFVWNVSGNLRHANLSFLSIIERNILVNVVITVSSYFVSIFIGPVAGRFIISFKDPLSFSEVFFCDIFWFRFCVIFK